MRISCGLDIRMNDGKATMQTIITALAHNALRCRKFHEVTREDSIVLR